MMPASLDSSTANSLPILGFADGSLIIEDYIDAAQNEWTDRAQRLYWGSILKRVSQEILLKGSSDNIPSNLQYAVKRIDELREEYQENCIQKVVSMIAPRIFFSASPYSRALSNYVGKAIKAKTASFLSPLPPKKAWSPFLERVKKIAEEVYENPSHSEYAIQMVANRILYIEAWLKFKDNQEIRDIFNANVEDFSVLKNQSEIDKRLKKDRRLAQLGLNRPGIWANNQSKIANDTKVENLSQIENGWEKGVGFAHFQGRRPTMEDTHLIGEFLPVGCLRLYASLYAVFDGHRGKNVAEFAQKNLITFLNHHLQQQNNPEITQEANVFNALRLGIVDLGEQCKALNVNQGTTAAIVLRVGQKLYVANVGDSRVLISSSKKGFIQATEDADPGVPSFHQNLIERGARLIQHYGGFRVSRFGKEGSLAMACALGDEDFPGITAEPKIVSFDIDELGEDSEVIIACDGLFEQESSFNVLERAAGLKKQGRNRKEIATELVIAAHKRGSADNLSVLVVGLAYE